MNRIVLNAGLDIGLVATFALVSIATQSFPLLQTKMPNRNRFLQYWMPVYQRIFWPVYLGLMAASYHDALWPPYMDPVALAGSRSRTLHHRLFRLGATTARGHSAL
jgi:hypothetical protein